MILERLYLGCLAQASYLVADETTKTAVIVDPRRDVDIYLERAKELGVEIRHVILTHFHADFVAGHVELRERTDATIHLGARAEADYAFSPLKEGDVIDLGHVRLEVLETPGHTPEGISILAFDGPDKAPTAVFTGDTLFIGDVGRPDLLASIGVTADELAHMLYHSLHEKLLKLPDETRVYPGHGAGSMCGKSMSDAEFSTIGEQKRTNYALQPMGRDEFVGLVTADQPAAPGYFAYDADLNRRERATLESSLTESLKPLTIDRVLELRDEGARLLDVREAPSFEAAHLRGSVNVGLAGRFATWVGTVLSKDDPIVLIADPGREVEAATRLGRIGFDGVVGYLEGGVGALATRPDIVLSTQRLTAAEVAGTLDGDHPPRVLDVRMPSEWEETRIEGSVNVPVQQLEERLADVPRDEDLVVVCRSGYRSSLACSLLERHGFDRLRDLAGGMEAWEAGQLATTTG